MTPLISGLVAVGAEMVGSLIASKAPEVAKGKEAVESFTTLLSQATGNQAEPLAQSLTQKGIQNLGDLSLYKRSLSQQLLVSPELIGQHGPFSVSEDVMGNYEVTTAVGNKVYINKDSTTAQLMSEYEDVDHMLDLSSQLPGANIDVLANQVKAYPRQTVAWSLGRETV